MMKFFLTLVFICLVNSAIAVDNNGMDWDITGDDIFDHIPKSHQHNWQLMVAKDGQTYLVDANRLESDATAEPMFNAWKEVFFRLYTRENPKTPETLTLFDDQSVINSHFNPDLPTRYNVHGWNNNGKSDVNYIVRDAYLKEGEYNVIIVDWGKGANNIIYSICRGRIDAVADVAAAMIDWLDERFGNPVSRVGFSGHSLGGHIAGLTGKRLKRGKMPRVVALDPAGPEFSDKHPEKRVAVGDADYVEILHTNAGSLGYEHPIGDADIYANNGHSQPGCTIDLIGSCAHGRSYHYFAESLTSEKGFLAQRCGGGFKEIGKNKCTIDGDPIMMGGEPMDVKAKGEYKFKTAKKSPYANV